MSEEKQLYGADLVVDSLINHDVDYVFGLLPVMSKMLLLWLKVLDVSQGNPV